MTNFRKLTKLTCLALAAMPLLTACTDDDATTNLGPLTPEESAFGKANDVFRAEEMVSWWRAGYHREGQLFCCRTCCREYERYGGRFQYR